MSDQGRTVYYIGLCVIVFLWMFVQPTYMPLSFGAGLFLGLAAIVSWQYVCIISFPVETKDGQARLSCKNCGHEWKKWEVPDDIPAVYQCPKCPEEESDEETTT